MIMALRGLIVATQFLTRLPTPRLDSSSAHDLSRASVWFPLVGAIIGAFVTATVALAQHQSALLAAALGLIVWVWITGAIHLDGLADMADALGASHRDPQRFLAVLSDPHIGTFGVVCVVLVLLLKFAALATLPIDALAALALIPAWARLGPVFWSRWLKPLKAGQGERLAEHLPLAPAIVWMVLLLAASALIAPVLLIAPLVMAGWAFWLHARVGGMTGDCLGAGIEVMEAVLLIALVLQIRAPLSAAS